VADLSTAVLSGRDRRIPPHRRGQEAARSRHQGRARSEVINESLLAAPKADAAPAKSAGRPTAWRTEYAGQATKLCRLGATDAQLADFFGIDDRTIARWKAGKPEFCRALEEGRAGGAS